MTREDLKRKFIACINMNAHDGVDTITLDQESVECMAEACLSAIEQSGCTICPNEATDEQQEAGALKVHHDPIIGDYMTAGSVYEAMLSSSPFKTEGVGVSCNRPETVEQSVSPRSEALQTDTVREALRDFDALMIETGGCGDGNCLVSRPQGMHTNSGCRCWRDKYTAQRVMIATRALREKLQSQIEERSDEVSPHDGGQHDTEN